jgi:hypothetical protein
MRGGYVSAETKKWTNEVQQALKHVVRTPCGYLRAATTTILQHQYHDLIGYF